VGIRAWFAGLEKTEFLLRSCTEEKKKSLKNKMEDKIKMAAKHEFSIAQSIFMQIT
jgi:hypothetical protein